MKINKSITEIIGSTPLLELCNIKKKLGLKANIIAKLEFMNPAGSVKDRVGKAMIEDAENKGILKKGATIIEPTSGNTGIGLACCAAAKGYKVILTMPETMSVERRMLLAAYGAELVLTEGKLGMSGAIAKAKELNEKIEGSLIMGQFENPSNPKAHYETTAPEIWNDTDGNIDFFVACVGTGGTFSGNAKYLKEKKADLKAVAVEPDTSAVLSGEPAGSHGIQGIGAGFIPQNMDISLCDEIIKASTDNAYKTAKLLVRTEGVLCGISSGAALWAAIELAKKDENKDKNIVVLLPDTGDRYLSAGVFD
ncbi:MAG: cysteine synthase A [Ruminiclostridium sp.]|nr:cysteine synthase A [Ruminiclostridium sp.]